MVKKPKLDMLGTAAGVLGLVVCFLALVLRIIGEGAPDFMTVRPANVLIAGAALLAAACWLKLEAKD